jgi:hypothetical protein
MIDNGPRAIPRVVRRLAFVYAWTGDKDRAIAEYARLLRVPYSGIERNALTRTGALNVHVMRRDPRFAPLQGDPRFEALLNNPANNAPLSWR